MYSPILPSGQQVFRIDIADKNDHPPVFNQKTYEAENIPEDANNHRLVAQVKANDTDDASTLEYSIVDGNIGKYNCLAWLVTSRLWVRIQTEL